MDYFKAAFVYRKAQEQSIQQQQQQRQSDKNQPSDTKLSSDMKQVSDKRQPPSDMKQTSDKRQPSAIRPRSSPSLSDPEKLKTTDKIPSKTPPRSKQENVKQEKSSPNVDVKIPPKTPPRPRQEKSSPNVDDKLPLKTPPRPKQEKSNLTVDEKAAPGKVARRARSRQSTGGADAGMNPVVKKVDRVKRSKKSRGRFRSTDAVDEDEGAKDEGMPSKNIPSEYYPMIEKPAPPMIEKPVAPTVTVTVEEKTVYPSPKVEKVVKYPKKKTVDPEEAATDFEVVATPRRPAVSKGSRKTAADRLAEAKLRKEVDKEKDKENSSSSSSEHMPTSE